MEEISNYYELLGVSRSVDPSSLHSAFRRQSKALHPDTTNLPIDEAAERFRLLCEAYEALSDPQRRDAYDAILRVALSSEVTDSASAISGRPLSSVKVRAVSELRPLSGGEWFSLLMLGASLVLSLLLGLGLALFNGRSW